MPVADAGVRLPRVGADGVGGHAAAQAGFQLLHAGQGAAIADGAAQLFGFTAREAGHDHRHADQLLLKQRNAQGAPEHQLQQRMVVGDRLESLAALHVGIHHVTDDGAGADDGYLHHEVVKAGGMIARQGRHLGAALDLKHADGVGLLQGAVGGRIVGR